MAKIFPQQLPLKGSELIRLSGLADERLAFQVAACNFHQWMRHYKVDVIIEQKNDHDWEEIDQPSAVKLYEIKNTPANFTVLPKTMRDSSYLSGDEGQYPDLLLPLSSGDTILLVPDQWQGIYVEFNASRDLKPGKYRVRVRYSSTQEAVDASADVTQTMEILEASLAEEKVWHTEWFHADCIADYYEVEVWSEEHWQAIESQIAMAVDHGINLLLTPLFTPPLDTAEGGERTTVQLVDITEIGDLEWTFDFTRFHRWVNLALDLGVKGFELCHLFTQWGAKAAPKIMVNKDGELIRRFFWDTPANGEYADFLYAFLPELLKELDELGIREKSFFHVSDEPSKHNLENYRTALNVVADILKDEMRIDALSDYAFYEEGLVEHPIPANNHIRPFLDGEVKDLWTYYCTSQALDVSNRYFSLPGVRTRIIGIQMFKYNIKGFLHWGYNFYNAQYSTHMINPFCNSDADGGFHAGDPYLVYPGNKYEAWGSLRLKWMQEAFQDLRALQALADATSHEDVVALIDEGLEEEVTFENFPNSEVYLLNLRRKVNERLANK